LTLAKSMHCKCCPHLFLWIFCMLHLHWFLLSILGIVGIFCMLQQLFTQAHTPIFDSILCLDSLKMHDENDYARLIHKWLNYEWKRLGHVNHLLMQIVCHWYCRTVGFASFFFYNKLECPHFLFFTNNNVTYLSSISRQWMRLGCFYLQVCLQCVHDEAPTIHME
jgi:hypothetical protein